MTKRREPQTFRRQKATPHCERCGIDMRQIASHLRGQVFECGSCHTQEVRVQRLSAR